MEHKPRFDAVQVAALLGITRGHVSRLCKQHGVGQLERNAWRLTGKDVERLKRIIEEGNPGKRKGRPKK
jgi:hypothetical protein